MIFAHYSQIAKQVVIFTVFSGLTTILTIGRPLMASDEASPLATLRKEHPRLIVTREDERRVKQLLGQNAQLRAIFEFLRKEADEVFRQSPVQHRLIGPRLLDQSRLCLSRVYLLATVYRVTGERRYADRAIKEMITAAGFQDWNPSHFLDTAEMTHALAIGYDWLYEVLDSQQRQTIRQAIVEKGLREGEKIYRKGTWWTKTSWNWNQVCNGGMTLGALAVADEEPQLAEYILAQAIKSIPIALANYAPDGAWAEGPGYWSYATHYTVYMLAGLQSALGTDFGLSDSPGFDKAGDFRIHVVGPSGLAFNFADGSARVGAAAPMFWLATRFGKPLYAWHEREVVKGRTPLHLWWYNDQSADITREPPAKWFRGADIVTLRSDWEDQAVFVGFKGGDNAVNHSHLELGSFVLDAQGLRWVLDLGSDNYNLPGYFGKQRWTYYRLGTQGQNTLVLDGQNQNPQAKAPVIAFWSSPTISHAVIDLSAAYMENERQTGIASSRVLRGIAVFGRNAVLVQDEIVGHSGKELQWQIHTEARVSIQGNRATLTQNDRQVIAEILAPRDLIFESQSANPPPPQRQNPGVTKLAIRTKLSDEPFTLAVVFWCNPLAKRPPISLRPLQDWEGQVATGR
ncbi:heparinase II/III family protein [Thermogutta sp.]|uniref:heparinase II/III domain-containing protein n=1 Tax=Thermogutta sp. TaxID=1962930 RepID=UPI0032202666